MLERGRNMYFDKCSTASIRALLRAARRVRTCILGSRRWRCWRRWRNNASRCAFLFRRVRDFARRLQPARFVAVKGAASIATCLGSIAAVLRGVLSGRENRVHKVRGWEKKIGCNYQAGYVVKCHSIAYLPQGRIFVCLWQSRCPACTCRPCPLYGGVGPHQKRRARTAANDAAWKMWMRTPKSNSDATLDLSARAISIRSAAYIATGSLEENYWWKCLFYYSH